MFEFLAILLLIGLFFVFNPYLFKSTQQGAPFFPLNVRLIEEALLLAQLKPNEILYDLGSGDGRVVLSAWTMGAQAIGIESNIFRAWYSKFWVFYFRVFDARKELVHFRLGKNVQILQQNFFQTPLNNADVVFCYLLPTTMVELEPKFATELKKGARVVSVAFALPTLKPSRTIAPLGIPIYLYIF